MQSITLQLETITPLLLKGANAQGKPELRVPAFRGAIRYWLRALLGTTLGDLKGNHSSLSALESKVMGSTSNGSAIGVRIPSVNYQNTSEKILPHKSDSTKREAIVEKTLFSLILQARFGTSPLIWNVALAALEVSILFGGVGLRARRGFGTFAIRSSSNDQIKLTPTSRNEWGLHITDVLQRAISATQAYVQSEGHSIVTSIPTVAARYPTASTLGRIRISDNKYKSPKGALIGLMGSMPDVAFMGGIKPRQSSPLWVRVIEVDGEYALLFCVLASYFSGMNYKELDNVLSNFSKVEHTVKGWNL